MSMFFAHPTLRRRMSLTGVLVATAVVAASCGSDGGTSSLSTSATTEPADDAAEATPSDTTDAESEFWTATHMTTRQRGI